MMRLVTTSVARRLPPGDAAREAVLLPRDEWRSGDLVVAEVTGHVWPARRVESASGRLAEVGDGDLIVGALGERRATLEAVGDWREVGADGAMTTLTRAGVLGRLTSAAPGVRSLVVPVTYRGHLADGGGPIAMSACALPPRGAPARLPPVVLLIASSMSAGKTTTAAAFIRRASRRGLRVAGVKLVGVARYADILAMRDAGADPVYDFVDAGLPSTIVPAPELTGAVHAMLGAVEDAGVDLLVAEAGASPLEPYGGDRAVAALGDAVALTVLCAADPYAVRGVIDAFGMVPDVVAGRVATTSAGVDLVDRLTGIACLDVTDPAGGHRIDALVEMAIERHAGRRAPRA